MSEPKPLDLEDFEKNIDCGCIEFWERWWNAKELERPKIVSELTFSIKSLLLSKTKSERNLMLNLLYGDISRYFEDSINFGMLLLLNKIKQRLKSACEFYLRYKDKPSLLWLEQFEFRKHLKNFGVTKKWVESKNYDSLYDWSDYNEWFFKLTFKGVFEDEVDVMRGDCPICGRKNVELDLDFGGCIYCAEKYAKEQDKNDRE